MQFFSSVFVSVVFLGCVPIHGVSGIRENEGKGFFGILLRLVIVVGGGVDVDDDVVLPPLLQSMTRL